LCQGSWHEICLEAAKKVGMNLARKTAIKGGFIIVMINHTSESRGVVYLLTVYFLRQTIEFVSKTVKTIPGRWNHFIFT